MVYIRTDMNDRIATGHLMRCLSIADAIRRKGEDVSFITADENASGLLNERGYQQIILGSKWNALENELDEFLRLIDEKEIKIILIDHYSVTEKYLEVLRKKVFVVYIDDLNAFLYPADMLICYAIYYEKFDYENQYRDVSAPPIFLLGTKFVPLRSKFQECAAKQISKEIQSLLIMSGGTDPYDAVKKILETIDVTSFDEIYAICGAFNKSYEKLLSFYAEYPHVHILKSVPDIDHYMKKADLAISAAGSALYELCAVGTPVISYTFADNQLDNAKKLDEDGIIPYAGDMRTDDVINNIRYLINEKINSQQYRTEITSRMQKLVDGKGADRIADKIVKYPAASLRLARCVHENKLLGGFICNEFI